MNLFGGLIILVGIVVGIIILIGIINSDADDDDILNWYFWNEMNNSGSQGDD